MIKHNMEKLFRLKVIFDFGVIIFTHSAEFQRQTEYIYVGYTAWSSSKILQCVEMCKYNNCVIVYRQCTFTTDLTMCINNISSNYFFPTTPAPMVSLLLS